MWYKQRGVATLLNGVTATGAGTAVDLGIKSVNSLRYFIKAATVTTGGTMKIQVSEDNSNWYDAATASITATGNTTGTLAGPFRYVRANLTARTDGTYTVSANVIFNP